MTYYRSAIPWRDLAHPFTHNGVPSLGGNAALWSAAAGPLHALVADHVVQGRLVFPGAGYLEMVRAAVEKKALHDVYFLQPLAVQASTRIECVTVDGRFEVRSGEADAIDSTMVHCTGATAEPSAWWRFDHAALRAPRHAADITAFYNSFHSVGLQYGPGYRTLAHLWGGARDAFAHLHGRSTHEGTQVHPADLDDALCMSIAVSGTHGGEMRLPFAIDAALLQGAPGELWAVRCRTVQHPPRLQQQLIIVVLWSCLCRLWHIKGQRRSRCSLGLIGIDHKRSSTVSNRVRSVQGRQRSDISTKQSGTHST